MLPQIKNHIIIPEWVSHVDYEFYNTEISIDKNDSLVILYSTIKKSKFIINLYYGKNYNNKPICLIYDDFCDDLNLIIDNNLNNNFKVNYNPIQLKNENKIDIWDTHEINEIVKMEYNNKLEISNELEKELNETLNPIFNKIDNYLFTQGFEVLYKLTSYIENAHKREIKSEHLDKLV